MEQRRITNSNIGFDFMVLPESKIKNLDKISDIVIHFLYHIYILPLRRKMEKGEYEEK